MKAQNLGRGGTPILGHTRDVRPELGEFSRSKNLRIGVNFCPKTCGWVIILIRKTLDWSSSVNNSPWEWVVFVKLNKTCCNLVNFGSLFLLYIVWEWVCFCLSTGKLQSADGSIFQWCGRTLRTNEVELTPPPGLKILHKLPRRERSNYSFQNTREVTSSHSS